MLFAYRKSQLQKVIVIVPKVSRREEKIFITKPVSLLNKSSFITVLI